MKTLALVLLLFVSPVAASIIEYQFSGTVIDCYEADNSFGNIEIGDPFLVQFAFDSGSPDLLPADTANGRYSGISTFLQIPGQSIAQLGAIMDVLNGGNFDTLTYDSSGTTFQIRAVFSGMPTAFSSDQLPTEFPDMNRTHILNVFSVLSGDKFAGTITAITIIPEPSVLAMMLVGPFLIKRRH